MRLEARGLSKTPQESFATNVASILLISSISFRIESESDGCKYLSLLPKRICVSSSSNEPRPIERWCRYSPVACLPKPSATFDGTEIAARLIWETNPHCSTAGKFAVRAIHGLDQIHTTLPNQKILVTRDHLNFARSRCSYSLFLLTPHASSLTPSYFPYTLSMKPSFSSSRTMLSSIRLSTVTLLPGACFNASSSWIFIPSRVV